jgi:hypothetical protein
LFQQLKNIHQSAKVQKSLGITDGQRLKLDNPALEITGSSMRRPKLPPPNFQLTFADLNDNQPTSQYHESNSDDDEDLPDIHDLLNAPRGDARQASSSSSDYSNTEIDALIRDVPMDVVETELAGGPLLDDLDSWQPYFKPATPRSSAKRPRESENVQPMAVSDIFTNTASERTVLSSPQSQPRKVGLFCVLLCSFSSHQHPAAKAGECSFVSG